MLRTLKDTWPGFAGLYRIGLIRLMQGREVAEMYLDTQNQEGTYKQKLCGKTVYWWGGEYEGECELGEGHEGDHFDGLSWYDDDGNQTHDS